MLGRTEIDHINYQINKAELRLAYQRTVVRKLGFDAEPRYADLAHDLLATMENRISVLHERRKMLLTGQSFEAHPATVGRSSAHQHARGGSHG